MKFVAAVAASISFVLGIVLSMQLIVMLFSGDASFSATQRFWLTFGPANFAKLIFGLSLISLAITVSTDRMISWLVTPPESQWVRNTLSYFAAFFAVIVLSTASFFLAQFPVIPVTHVVAFFVVTLSSLVAALVFGLVSSFSPAT